jgi:hypothetical protein
LFVRFNVKFSDDAELSVKVITCVVAGAPITCEEKVRYDGARVIGSWQALAPFNARQIFPKSPETAVLLKLPGHAVVATK